MKPVGSGRRRPPWACAVRRRGAAARGDAPARCVV